VLYRKHRSYIPYLRTTQRRTSHVNLLRDKWLPLQGTTRCFVAANAQRKLRQDREGRMQAAMAKKKRHSRVEIATKLAQATDLATQGKSQREIAHTLGVSVMTLHRWRKVPPGHQPVFVATHEAGRGDRIAELQLENLRLRRVVTDLLLEKIRLEEAAQTSNAPALTPDPRLRSDARGRNGGIRQELAAGEAEPLAAGEAEPLARPPKLSRKIG
jgi:putative transposase